MVAFEGGSVTAAPAPLAGWRVAVTARRRREEQARLLRGAGAGVVFAGIAEDLPASTGRPTGPPTSAVPEVCLLDVVARRHVDAVTFTTTTAVRELVARATDHHRGREALAALAGDVMPVCLGAGCAEAAARAGMTGVVRSERLRFGALVGALVERLDQATVSLRLAGHHVVLQGALAVVAGEEVWLTGREQALLAVLARRPGTVVAKEELLRSVWGAEGVDPHAVEVAVGRLRRRLGPAAGGLETVARRGYRLTGD